MNWPALLTAVGAVIASIALVLKAMRARPDEAEELARTDVDELSSVQYAARALASITEEMVALRRQNAELVAARELQVGRTMVLLEYVLTLREIMARAGLEIPRRPRLPGEDPVPSGSGG